MDNYGDDDPLDSVRRMGRGLLRPFITIAQAETGQ
jgi:hypothetical protein